MKKISIFLERVIDVKGIDSLINYSANAIKNGSRHLRFLQSGQLGSYFLLMVLGILILLIIFLYGI